MGRLDGWVSEASKDSWFHLRSWSQVPETEAVGPCAQWGVRLRCSPPLPPPLPPLSLPSPPPKNVPYKTTSSHSWREFHRRVSQKRVSSSKGILKQSIGLSSFTSKWLTKMSSHPRWAKVIPHRLRCPSLEERLFYSCFSPSLHATSSCSEKKHAPQQWGGFPH